MQKKDVIRPVLGKKAAVYKTGKGSQIQGNTLSSSDAIISYPYDLVGILVLLYLSWYVRSKSANVFAIMMCDNVVTNMVLDTICYVAIVYYALLECMQHAYIRSIVCCEGKT